MVSINTFTTNSAVLASLRQTNSDLATTQSRIASGLKIASAKDNASIWATAQSIRTDLAAQDGAPLYWRMVVVPGRADAAYTAMTTIQDLLGKIQTAASGLADAAANNVEVQKTISNYQAQLLATVKSASIQGVNLLTGVAATVSATIGQDSGSAITMDFTTVQVLAGNGAGGLLDAGATFGSVYDATFTATSTAANITTFTTALTTAITAVNNYAAQLGNYATSLGNQQDFLAKIAEIRKTALSSLVDADMEEESAKVQALQVKQQLAYQALSIGNSSAQNILTLFR